MDFEEHCINGLAFSSLASARSSNARASHFSSLAIARSSKWDKLSGPLLIRVPEAGIQGKEDIMSETANDKPEDCTWPADIQAR